jgi:hypothetical protein
MAGLGKELEEMERSDPELRAIVAREARERWRANLHRAIDERRATEGKPPLRRGRG